MKIVILLALCVLATNASPLEQQEVSPMFNIRVDTRFLIFTRFNPTVGQVVNINDMATVAASHFSGGRPTRVLIHGWQR